MTEPVYVLHGAGAAGRYALKYMRERGDFVIAFADNDPAKQGTAIEGVPVRSPQSAKRDFVATWVACAISRPAATEIRAEMREMGVKTKPLWECIPVCHGLPPEKIRDTLFPAMGDIESQIQFNDQVIFRKNPDYDYQLSPSPISELYFPNFIKHREDEHFVDCGAADGDSVEAFAARWEKSALITALEPDEKNFEKLTTCGRGKHTLHCCPTAVGDFTGELKFVETGDYSAHLLGSKSRDASGGNLTTVECARLDDMFFDPPPSYIKMDIEGAELEALWGAKKLLKEHSPVLAICAYHTSDHLWQIPLLIHAIHPDYSLYLRRYAEGAWELVWYAVPKERVQ